MLQPCKQLLMRMEKVIYQSMFNIFAEYYTTGNKRLTEKSFVILSSVTGTTQEVVQAVQEIKRSAQRYLVLSMQKTVF